MDDLCIVLMVWEENTQMKLRLYRFRLTGHVTSLYVGNRSLSKLDGLLVVDRHTGSPRESGGIESIESRTPAAANV